MLAPADNMRIGANTRKHMPVFAAAGIFLFVQAAGIWQYYRLHQPEAALWGCDFPWAIAVVGTAGIAVVLRRLASGAVSLTGRVFFQRLPSVAKFVAEVLLALLIGAAFAAAGVLFSDFWIQYYWCGPLFGLLKSNFMYFWSLRLVFPADSALAFWAMRIRD
jgi:hypothetical protein